MKKNTTLAVTSIALCALAAPSLRAQAQDHTLPSVADLKLERVQAAAVDYRGRPAIKLTEAPGSLTDGGLAILAGPEFGDGVIELEVAGSPSPGARELARGFVGVAFRVAPGAQRYEYIYLRPTNGRANDQVRRNHSTQYASHPDHPWQRLRKEEPEKYEAYVDLEPGVWTKMKVVVEGTSARLYVHGSEQPTLVVNDLKLGTAKGAVALWIGPGTEGHFAGLRITRK